MAGINIKSAKILVFSTEKISDPAIDMAGLLKLHYPPTVYTISIPCSSGVKSRWILHAFKKGFDGVFIAADGSDCPYGESCTAKTGQIVSRTHEMMRQKNIEPARLRMAAICSVCSESFVKQMKSFNEYLLKNSNTRSCMDK
jgi:coenzyme F420-reducing hydrogenase delta subunit